MKIYISGKISGLTLEEAQEKFRQAEETLQAEGHETVNPLTKPGFQADWTWEQHMIEDIQLLLECDQIYLLENWTASRGAQIEKQIAEVVGMPVIFQTALKLTEKREERIKKSLSIVQQAIQEVTGLGIEEYSNDSRKRDAYFCRLLYSNSCVKMGVHNRSLISRHLQKSPATISRALKKFDDEFKYNPAFRDIAEEVNRKLS